MTRQEPPQKYGKFPCKICRKYRNKTKDKICDNCIKTTPYIEVKA